MVTFQAPDIKIHFNRAQINLKPGLISACYYVSALHMACGSGHSECVKTLLEHGAVNETDDQGSTPRSLTTNQTIHDMIDFLTPVT
jgi:hypothetical protein